MDMTPKNGQWGLCCLAMLLLCGGSPALAQQNSHMLQFRLLADVPAEAGIEEICCENKSKMKQAPLTDSLRIAYGSEPFWVKLEGVSGEGLIQFTPILDEVALFARGKEQSEWRPVRTGDNVSNSQKVFITPFMALPLPKDVDTDHIYAKIFQQTMVSLSATHWALPSFSEMQETDRTIKMFLLGFVVAIALYNAVVSILVRDLLFLANAGSVASLLVTSLYLSGYGTVYVWAPFYSFSNEIFYTSVWLAVLCGAAFIFLFIRDSQIQLRSRQFIFLAPILATLAGAMLLIAVAPYWMIQGTMLACAALLFLSGSVIIGWEIIHGNSKAFLLAAPFTFAMVPGLILLALDKITGFDPLHLGNNALEFTLALEAILFSLALASRIRLTEETNRKSTRKLLSERATSAARSLAAQDRERQRLSEELHDGVGQELLVVVGRLKRLTANSRNDKTVGSLREICEIISNIMRKLRRISHDMHPATIGHLGLAETIRGLVEQMNLAGSIDFKHCIDVGEIQISQHAHLQIVRIVQECVANVAKHSKARKCLITAGIRNDRLLLSIEDDGVGIEQNKKFGPEPGLGMNSIEERVRGLNGTWRYGHAAVGGLGTWMEFPMDALSQSEAVT
tara:strand:- start:799 stop:2664 length:1866 start_codon:yes stop_codon:yes gene_type:complete